MRGRLLGGLLAMCMLAGYSGSAGAEEALPSTPPKVEAFLKLCETSRRGAILQLEHRLRGLKLRNQLDDRARQQVARLEADLELLRHPKGPIVPPLSFPLEVGEIGRLPGLTFRVEKIGANDELLGQAYFRIRVPATDQRSRAGLTVQPVTMLIQGLPSARIQPGTEIQILDVLEIRAREILPANGARSTILWTARKFDMEAVQPYFQRLQAAAE